MHRNIHVLIGGCLLAFGAAVVNVVFLLQTGTSVSHLTGDVAKLAADLSRISPEIVIEAKRVATAAAGFVLGAVFSGYLIHDRNLELSRPYGRTIILIGALLLSAHWVILTHELLAITTAAFACGMQNALAARFHGIILRTTHLTGLLTDFGAAVGMRLRGHPVPRHGILVPAMISAAYFTGAVVGCVGMLKYQAPMLPLTGAGYLGGGIVWSVLKRTIWKG